MNFNTAETCAWIFTKCLAIALPWVDQEFLSFQFLFANNCSHSKTFQLFGVLKDLTSIKLKHVHQFSSNCFLIIASNWAMPAYSSWLFLVIILFNLLPLWACQAGKYGDGCQSYCTDGCLILPCNHITGDCPNGMCREGYSGAKCESMIYTLSQYSKLQHNWQIYRFKWFNVCFTFVYCLNPQNIR